jgi:SAM-dependent methyltransferase
MDKIDRDDYIQRYSNRLKEYGYSPETLGWGKNGRQELRFFILSEFILHDSNCSVLDVGCGFGDLFPYLRKYGWKGKYLGIDIVPELVEVAKRKYPEAEFMVSDIIDIPMDKKFDFVLSSGIFNAQLKEGNNLEHIEISLLSMLERANKMVSSDFMSTYVDFQKSGAWHTDPKWLMDLIRQKMSKRFSFRLDYMPFEFAVFIYKNDSVNEQHFFTDFKGNFDL